MATATIGLRSRRFPTETTIQTADLAPSRRGKKRRGISTAAAVISLIALLPIILWLTVATHDVPPPTIPLQRPVMTAFMEHPSTINLDIKPLPPRTCAKQQLIEKQYQKVTTCATLFETLPIDEYPETDPYLPWIHDVFPDFNGSFVHFVAQNRRRCQTGKGVEKVMKFWEPQIALFQPVPVVQVHDRIRLASSLDEATAKETRFICRFHSMKDDSIYETLSEFPFNYEYISWRKGYSEMFQREGKDNVQFWLSQLLFRCPVPKELQHLIATQQHVDSNDFSHLFIDVIPIRTAPRVGAFLFTKDHVGDDLLSTLPIFDLKLEFGDQHFLPKAEDSGRWGNIPICRPPPLKKHRLVACTWTASAYTRRGDVVGISDTEARVREWILFHKMVGFDHVYVYDNTAPGLPSSLSAIAEEFPDFVDYHRWPCSICNNNRPTHRNPGERSSQYAAEASCRERYGQSSDWMAFIDTDEYLIPMAHDTWKPLLDQFDKVGTHVLKMRSSRAKPRIEHMTPMKDQSKCVDPVPHSKKPPGGPQQCLEPIHNQTYLQVYNCEFIRPPRPERFERAMKQIYRPDYVQSHFVHYSTVTNDVSKYRKNFGPAERYLRNVHGRGWKDGSPEVFLDELHQGLLVHARSVLPHESQYREQGCKTGSPYGCDMGYLCPDTTPFVDEKHKEKAFVDAEGRYCNCWKNDKVEETLIPKLNSLVKQHMTQSNAKAVVGP